MNNTNKMIFGGICIAIISFAIGYHIQKRKYKAFACQTFNHYLKDLESLGFKDTEQVVIDVKAKIKENCS